MSVIGDSAIDSALLQKILNNLQCEDRRRRKSALDELRNHLFNHVSRCPSLLGDNEVVLKAVIRCFSDQSEACRESAVNMLRDLISGTSSLELNLSLLMPVLSVRLGSAEVVEPSEEVRHALSELLHAIVKSRAKDLLPYFNDIVQILTKLIVDPFPKIKKESCECVSALAIAIPANFHMQSESLVKPLVQILTHQQYRVRVAAINALSNVVRFGNNKSIKDVSGPFAERLFDQTPQVREAVTDAVGVWLVHLPDRYSYFHIMIPLMLTSINDQSPDIQERAWVLWNQAGEQWKEENQNDIKDNIDFLDNPPTHYPSNLRRPNIGCRILVKRHLHKIAPALVRELEDWLADVRIKASQLLCVLVINAEADLHQYVEQLLLGMYRACNDEDPRVVNNIERAAHLMGYFIPPANYWDLMHPIMENSCHQGHLCILASIMSGAEPTNLQNVLPSIITFLQQPFICQSREVQYQTQLLKCCHSTLSICGNECLSVSQKLFNILVTVLALAASKTVHDFALDLLNKCKNLEGFGPMEELYQKYMRPLLQDVSAAPELWTVHSPERLIFQTLILYSGSALAECLDIMVPTLSASLQPDNQDAEMKLKLMTNVAIILQNTDKTHSIPPDQMDPFLFSLFKGVIVPNLVWKAGRTAEALRTITVSCLLAILQGHDICQEETITYLLDCLVPLLLTLVEDASRKTRMYSCYSLSHIILAAQNTHLLNAEHVHKIFNVILKRLDDVDDGVRKISVEVLRKLFTHLPKDYDIESSSAHIEALYSTLLIHLDDPSDEFSASLLGVLKELAGLKPKYLFEKLVSSQANFRNQTACEDLTTYISKLYLNIVAN